MIKVKIPLIKNSDYSSIYFDFKTKEPYIQWFQGYDANGHTSEYSKSNTFWLGMTVSGFAAILGIILDKIFVFPVFLSLVVAGAVGIILGKFLLKMMIEKYMGKREYRKITKVEILQVIERPESKKIWKLWLIEIFLILLALLGAIIMLSNGEMKGKDFIMSGISTFGITLLHCTVYPRLTMKARKILKKQLKEGKFDD